jgi:hypothetical protein
MGPTQQHRASTTVEPAGWFYPARLRLDYDLGLSRHHRASTTVVKPRSNSPALCLAGSFKTTLPGTGRYHGNNNDSTAPRASLWIRFPAEAGKFQNCALTILRPCARLQLRSWWFLPSLTRAIELDVERLTVHRLAYRNSALFGVWQLPIVLAWCVKGSAICYYGGNRWGFEGILFHSRCIETSRCLLRD